MRFIAFACLSGMVVGCATAPAATRTLSFAAQLEDDDPDTHLLDLPAGKSQLGDSVVRVVAGRNGICSGVLVDDAIVLTAQHCVTDERGTMSPALLFVELGGDALPWGRAGARRVIPCEGWDGTADFDVAALVLEARIPKEVPRIPIAWNMQATVERGFEVVAMGFGSSMTVAQLPSSDLRIWSSHRTDRTGSLAWASDQALGADLASRGGDSGSPILSAATGEIVAITALGREGDVTSNQTPLTVGARVDACLPMLAAARAAEMQLVRQ